MLGIHIYVDIYRVPLQAPAAAQLPLLHVESPQAVPPPQPEGSLPLDGEQNAAPVRLVLALSVKQSDLCGALHLVLTSSCRGQH